ncbi:MAG: hypothetical protein U9N53_13390 [Bacteroidota bacterium]|nr:hypothetical protein [Bacteroidota bacterium]
MKPHYRNSLKIISFSSFLFTFTLFSQAQDVAWEKMFLYDAMGIWNESSELEDPKAENNEIGKYCACWLFDKDLTTAWVEGVKGDGIEEYVLLGNEKTLPDKIHINNGYQKSESVYLKNGRPKALKLSLYVAYYLPADFTELGGNFYCLPYSDSILIELKDEMGTQVIELLFDKQEIDSLKKLGDLSFNNEFGEIIAERLNSNSDNDWYEEFYGFIIKLEIIDVYKGSRWDDTCISDIWFSTEEKKHKKISADERIIGIFEGEDGNIYFSTSLQERILLASARDIEDEDDIVGGELSIVLMDVSPDKEWAQIDFLYSHEAYVRVEEIPFLYNVRHSIKVNNSVLGDYYSMYGFVEKNGNIFIDTDKGMFDLEEILKIILK